MSAVIIRKKDVEKLGRDLIKGVYDFLHDDYILKEFPQFQVSQQKFKNDLTHELFSRSNYNIISTDGKIKLKYEKLDEDNFEEVLKSGVEQIKNKTLSIYVIFKILTFTSLDSEIDEDLYFKKQAFLNIYKVFDMDYSYLDD